MAEQISSLQTGIKYKETPIGKIPVDWEVIPVDKICKIKRGASPRPIGDPSYFSESGRGWVRISDVTSTYKYLKKTTQYLSEEGVSKSVKVEPGNLIMSICATVGKPIIVDMKACIHDGFVFFSDLSKHVEKIYLFYFLQKNEKKISGKGQIGTQGNLNTDIVKKTLLPLPTFPEQKKIAEILTTIDDAIEKTAQIIEKTREAKKGLMQRLLTRGIGHHKFKKTEIGEIPEEWKIKKLIDTAKNEKYSFTGGPFGSNLKEDSYTAYGVRIIQLQNIGDGQFLDNYKIFTSEEKADELKSCNIFPDDIIIAKMADPVARACFIPKTDKRYLMASDGIRLSVDKNEYDLNFILYVINSKYFRENAERHSTGTTRLRIGLTDLRNLPLAIPPLSEQKQIAGILFSIDEEIKKELQHKEQLESLKKGLMQVLLTGKVRVNVNYEADI